jgi:hypothetical protein
MRLLIVALALSWLACSKQVPHSGPSRGTELAVWVYETFPPATGEAPVRFRLTPAELAQVNAVMPDVADADDHLCKCGVPRFGIELYERGATAHFAEGHFFHGPDELVVTFDAGGGGRMHGQQRFHDALVAVIQARGHWK